MFFPDIRRHRHLDIYFSDPQFVEYTAELIVNIEQAPIMQA